MDNGQLKMDTAGAVTDVPRGHKQTEVGVIPDDWRQVQVSDVAIKIGSGVTPTGGSQRYVEFGRPFVRSQNVGWGEFLLDDLAFIDQATHEEFSGTELKLGDVLLNITGASIGRSALVGANLVGGNVNQHVCIVRVNTNEVISGFVNRLLLSSLGQRQIDSFQAGGNREGLNFSQVASIKIPLPPTRAEQEAIAEALSDADALIESLEQLLAKKSQIKQGAMQDLLTGKQRLPGFSEGWKPKKISDVCWFQEGPGVRNTQFTTSGIKLLNGTNIVRGVLNLDSTSRFISEAEAFGPYGHFLADAGDIVLASSGVTIERLHEKVAFVAQRDLPFCMNTSTIRFKPLKELLVSGFLYQFLASDEFKRMIGGQATGSAQLNFGPSHIERVELSLPSVKEQTAIATILSDMDAEIAQLESRLTKARQIKQGMMQELLTGQIRLVRPNLTAVSLPEREQPKSAKGAAHNRQIEEAAMLGVLAALCGTERYPLARVRRTKLMYLFQRHLGQRTDAYLKKAAGPYNPGTRYKGPEGIAVKNGYVRVHHNGTYEGFVAGDKVSQAQTYLEKWHGAEVLSWLEQMRFKKTDELELLATIDMAMQDLRVAAKPVTMRTIKQVIHDHPEWEAKLEREIFSDGNLERAIQECSGLFA